jgi:AcrR family transcriptional regulator
MQHAGGKGDVAANGATPRQRLLLTAYRLFRQSGVNAVGVDRIVAEAAVAKTTLYRHFPSKDELAVSVLRHHDQVWTRGWLEQAIRGRGTTPGEQLLGIFDAFDEWFNCDDYEGCLFARALLETGDPASPVYAAAAMGLENVRAVISALAEAGGARDPTVFALQIQMLLLGAIVAAVSGQLGSARQARDVARLLLERDGIPVGS